jgi:hypothetical protein
MPLIQKIKTWYRGKYVPPPPNDPDSPIFIISPGHYEQPAFAKFLRVVGRFWLAHWQWIVGTAIAATGLIFALLKS